MIRVLMLDLGGTLIDGGNQLFPHVPEALEIIREFETEAHEPLSMCLVSDFYMPTPARTVQDIFQEYVSLLENLNLRQLFEPVERRVTLSTHAGVNKPERRIFELAVERLGLKASLDECLFITENAKHTEQARHLGIKTLLFGETVAEDGFSDWSEAPLLIAQMLNPESLNNLEGALRLRLAVEYDLELIFVGEKSEDGIIRGQVNKSHSLPVSGFESRQSSVLTLPVNVEVEMNNQGRILAVNSEEPDKETLDDAAHYIKTLDENKQISRRKGPLAQGETHRETVNEKGEKRIKRERFSAF
jgi:HAD superfamily hydrolase (TIGR01509 family)